MSAASVIKVSERSNDAPAKGDVQMVDMLACHRSRPKIDRYGCEDDLLEVALEVRVVGADRVERRAIKLVQVRREELERSWALASARPRLPREGSVPFPNPAIRCIAGWRRSASAMLCAFWLLCDMLPGLSSMPMSNDCLLWHLSFTHRLPASVRYAGRHAGKVSTAISLG